MTLIDKAEVQSAVRAYLVHESSEIAQHVEQIIAAVPPALAAAVPADLAEAGEVRPPFFFDRYINGVRMAEDVCVEREATLESAMRVAARIAAKGPNGEPTVLIYRSTETVTLLARIAAQEAQIKGLAAEKQYWRGEIDTVLAGRADEHDRAEAAETALAAMTKERDDLANANYRQASCIHVAAANLGPNCSATVDGLPKAARHVAAERDALLLAAQGLVEVLDQNETKGPLPDTALMFCWLAAQNVRAVLRGIMLEKPE